MFRVLRDVFPSRALTSISRQDASALVAVLEGLPANLGKKRELKGLAVPQAVERGRALGLPTIQPTINHAYLMHIAAMFNCAVKEQWIASNPFSGMAMHDPVGDAEHRDLFTAEQLQTLLSSAP